jgi:hypothetical protein
MIPDFEANGQLPVGYIRPTLSIFKQRFVIDCPGSVTRENIFNGYIKFCSKLLSLNAAEIQWVNGSFTTDKENPNDIDFVTHIDVKKLNPCDEVKETLSKLNDRERVKKECKCDAYFIPLYPPEMPERHADTVKSIKYWSKWFARDRENNPKGLIEFDLTDESFDIGNCNGGV